MSTQSIGQAYHNSEVPFSSREIGKLQTAGGIKNAQILSGRFCLAFAILLILFTAAVLVAAFTPSSMRFIISGVLGGVGAVVGIGICMYIAFKCRDKNPPPESSHHIDLSQNPVPVIENPEAVERAKDRRINQLFIQAGLLRIKVQEKQESINGKLPTQSQGVVLGPTGGVDPALAEGNRHHHQTLKTQHEQKYGPRLKTLRTIAQSLRQIQRGIEFYNNDLLTTEAHVASLEERLAACKKAFESLVDD